MAWLTGALGVVVGAAVAVLALRRHASKAGPVVSPASLDDQRALAQARAVADRLQAALDALPVGVVVADAAGRVVVRNRASDSSGGDTHNEVLVQAAVQHHLRGALRGGQRSQTVELYGPPRRVVVVHAQPLNGEGAVATIEDITERSRLDSVRTDFVANISHELKTPIGALAVLAETMIDEDDPDLTRRLAGKTVNEVHRVAGIIDDLLELSRIELAGDLVVSRCIAGALARESATRSSYAAQQREVDVRVADIPDDLVVNADAAQIASALGNLVDNAVKYSEPGGSVTIAAFPESNGVTFSVTDTGIGIPSHDLDRIFERFYRVDRARSRGTGGTGLGLSIVRHVAGNHGGAVTVESREGEGSTFRLFIPSQPASALTNHEHSRATT